MRELVTRTGENEKIFKRKNSGTEIRRETREVGVERGIKREKKGRREKSQKGKTEGNGKKGKEKALKKG
jgi:hypothetical protein